MQTRFKLGVVVGRHKVLQKIFRVLALIQELQNFQFGDRKIIKFRGNLTSFLLLRLNELFETLSPFNFQLFLHNYFSLGQILVRNGLPRAPGLFFEPIYRLDSLKPISSENAGAAITFLFLGQFQIPK